MSLKIRNCNDISIDKVLYNFISYKYDKDVQTQFSFVLRMKSELQRNYKQKKTVILYSYLPKSLTEGVRKVSECSLILYGQTVINTNSNFIYLDQLKYFFIILFLPLHLLGFKEL